MRNKIYDGTTKIRVELDFKDIYFANYGINCMGITDTMSFIIDICINRIVALESANMEHTIKCLNTFNFIQ